MVNMVLPQLPVQAIAVAVPPVPGVVVVGLAALPDNWAPPPQAATKTAKQHPRMKDRPRSGARNNDLYLDIGKSSRQSVCASNRTFCHMFPQTVWRLRQAR